jgi:DNA-binding NtrC family response regulator
LLPEHEIPRTVLLLEDDPSSSLLLQTVLERRFQVLVTNRPEAAIEISAAESLALLICDNQLRSDESGLQTALRIHKVHPNLPILITSGTPPEGWSDVDFECFAQLVNSARIDYLQKPFLASAVWGPIERLLSGSTEAALRIYKAAVGYRSRDSRRKDLP